MSEPGLTAKVVAVHEALEEAGIPHAFGGALALAFCTNEPRATKDIDVNVFLPPARVEELVAALPAPISVDDADRARIERDAQTRLWWGHTPVDVFLSNHPYHDHTADNRRRVPFAGIELPVIACADLAVFKAFFARPKDAIDIGSMVRSAAVDLEELRRTVTGLLGEERADFFRLVEDATEEGDPPIFGRS